ncbi:Alpha-mannosidase 2x [Halotydeus destructor]|nr:Alpha-mannosidase 2x [Halotydeus destructor]
MVRGYRQGRIRFLLLGILIVTVIVICAYHGLSGDSKDAFDSSIRAEDDENSLVGADEKKNMFGWITGSKSLVCNVLSKENDAQINTNDLYPQLNFNPAYKQYWNRTFEKRYNEKKGRWRTLPMKIIIMPHSHNDPGWLKTFENYYYSSTVHILNGMVEKLTKNPELKFIWSEISFFAKWWESLKTRPQIRDATLQLIRKGNLEIATGGWVMTDEAGAHYYSMIDQLIEGHQWLKVNLGLKDAPSNGWSIDPFGHSASWAYMLREAGISNTVIQRTHFGFKQYLAEKQSLEFVWQQQFERQSELDRQLYCLMAPFDLYSTKHTCGPDTNVCLQFDFRRISGEYSESRSVPITKENIAEKAHLILGQYGRTASLFPHNVVLIPLGDDFRYNFDIEWDQQRQNYASLMNYINTNKEEFNDTEIQFGTLKDYFDEVHARRIKLGTSDISLTGDFFPYGDVYADSKPSYWTGYFTTRPFYKSLAREVEHWLRSAEILYSFSLAFVRQKGDEKAVKRLEKDYHLLATTRQSLGLFQHHDAITGTAKEVVMEDYGKQLHRGLTASLGVISHSAQFLVLHDSASYSSDTEEAHPQTSYLYPDVYRPSWSDLTRKVVLKVPPVGSRKFVVFNSKTKHITEPVRLLVNTPLVQVTDTNSKNVLKIQVNPIWDDSLNIDSEVYEILFIPSLPPLSLTTFSIENLQRHDVLKHNAVISVFLNDAKFGKASETRNIFEFKNPADGDFELNGARISAIIDRHTGYLKAIKLDNEVHEVNLILQAYKSTEFYSGAYLFSYSRFDPMTNVTERYPIVKRVDGKITAELVVEYSPSLKLVYRVYKGDHTQGSGLEIEVNCDISLRRELINWELVMRLSTAIKNDDKQNRLFYTDSNGFQMLRRRFVASLGNEANYYPMTSSMYIEDSQKRLTILSSHSHGVTSPRDGMVEIMLERKIRYDDNRGLGEGILDNKPFKARFWILLESVVETSELELPNLTPLAQSLSAQLLYPPVIVSNEATYDRPMRAQVRFLNESFPCEIHLVTHRTLPKTEDFTSPSRSSLMVFHNRGTSCKTGRENNVFGCQRGRQNQIEAENVNFDFNDILLQSVHRTLLTGMNDSGGKSITNYYLAPMQLVSFNVTYA